VSGRTIVAGLDLLHGLGLRVKHTYWSFGGVAVEVDPGNLDALDVLVGHPLIDYVSYSGVARIAGARMSRSDGAMSRAAPFAQTTPPGLGLTKITSAWADNAGGSTKILFIDTGVDASHDDLPTLSSGNCDGSSTWDGCEDDNHHGTFVAGIAVARNNSIGIKGGAYEIPASSIYSYAACDSNGDCTEATLTAGIDQGVTWGVDIINISLATDSNDVSMAAAIASARTAGIFIAAGMGNIAPGDSPVTRYPAAYYGVTAVSGVDMSGNFQDTTSLPSGCDPVGMSEYGATVDLAAPFWSRSTVPTDAYEDEDDGWCGTSFATPFVTAAAAQVMTKYPSFTAAQVEQFLFDYATDKGTGGWDILYGYGVLNVAILAPLSVSIDGPSVVNNTPGSGACTWVAVVSGGGGQYTYEWSGKLTGTQSSVTGLILSAGTLTVEVDSRDGIPKTKNKYITVDPDAPDCV
jgi:subtilisin